MKIEDLAFENLNNVILAPYKNRAPSVSARYMRWFLENIFRLDRQDADDTCVDEKLDKGVDGIYVSDASETVYIFQSKVRQNPKSTIGDTDLKEFAGTLHQFKNKEGLDEILSGNAAERLKQSIRRNKLSDKIEAGFALEGIFLTNVNRNKDAVSYLKNHGGITLYDADVICSEYVDISVDGGIKDSFEFDVSDTDVITYSSGGKISSKIFLANALQLVHLKGISDGKLFEQNVRLSLGNTKVNKALTLSIKDKKEHGNFALYHNGINILCNKLIQNGNKLKITDYVVVNGAQSLTSLFNTKSSITDDLKILVKVIETKGNADLTEKITTNSNNQNAIKPRDQRSNHGIQRRLKKEIEDAFEGQYAYEVKRGEKLEAELVISNEDAGLALLAIDLGEPWSCHQKYKVMDESHGKIFGRPEVTGWKIVGQYLALASMASAVNEIEDKSFANYNLTRYFLAYVAAEIIKDSNLGKKIFSDFRSICENGKLDQFLSVFETIATTAALDLNAEILPEADIEVDGKVFDYKSDLKSPNWCRSMAARLKASYKKDVKRKKVESVESLLEELTD